MFCRLFTRDLNLIWLQNLALLAAYTLVGALMPLYIQESGLPDSTNGLIMGTGSLGLLLSLLLMGHWIDRSDPRLFIAAGALLWALTSALLVVVPGMWMLTLCRFTQGFAYALFYTAALVYATRSIADGMRGTVVGLIEAVGALAIGISPFAAFPLASTRGYSTVFWIAALLSLACASSVFLLSPRPAPLSNPENRKSTLLLSRHALIPGLVAACLFSVAVAFVNLAPLIAQEVGVASIGLYMGLRALGTVPTRILSGAIADRFSVAWAVIPGFLAAIAAMFLLPVIVQPSHAYLVPALFGLGMGSVSPALTAWMLRTTPATERAFAVNTFTILAEGSGFLGSWVMGWILEVGNRQFFYLLVLILGVGLSVFLKTSRKNL